MSSTVIESSGAVIVGAVTAGVVAIAAAGLVAGAAAGAVTAAGSSPSALAVATALDSRGAMLSPPSDSRLSRPSPGWRLTHAEDPAGAALPLAAPLDIVQGSPRVRTWS